MNREKNQEHQNKSHLVVVDMIFQETKGEQQSKKQATPKIIGIHISTKHQKDKKN